MKQFWIKLLRVFGLRPNWSCAMCGAFVCWPVTFVCKDCREFEKQQKRKKL